MLSADDERQITSLLSRYATGIDQHDWVLLESCFAENCRSDYGIGRWNSAQEITAFMKKAFSDRARSLHRLSNIVLDGDGAKASGRTYVDAVTVPLSKAEPVTNFAAYYEDEFIKTSTGWKIAARRLTCVDYRKQDSHPLPWPAPQPK